MPDNVIRITDSPAVYTVTEVAQLLNLPRSTTYAMVRSGEIPATRFGKRWVVPKAQLQEWLKQCAVPAQPKENANR